MNNREIERAALSDFDAVAQRVMTVQDVSAYLRVHPSTVYRLLKRNEIPAFRLGSDWRFSKKQVTDWIENQPRGEVTRKVP